jgi:hypothetical protein
MDSHGFTSARSIDNGWLVATAPVEQGFKVPDVTSDELVEEVDAMLDMLLQLLCLYVRLRQTRLMMMMITFRISSHSASQSCS